MNTDTLVSRNDARGLIPLATVPVNGNGHKHPRFSMLDMGCTPPEEVKPVFESPAMRRIAAAAERIAPSSVTVLISGETGTGKEVVADLIHDRSGRKGLFVKINCAALPGELVESELFGSLKGSFTGSRNDRKGLLREALGGTVLLDEISEMPMAIQPKLLRVLQEHKVRPIGGKVFYPINCRVIASTNQLPIEAMRNGKLRADLFYRLSVITIHVPPLRERCQDIVPLAEAFLRRFARENGRPDMTLTRAAKTALLTYDWPGNVRELEGMIQRSVIMTDNRSIDVADLFPESVGEIEDHSQDQGNESPGLTKSGKRFSRFMRNAKLQLVLSALRERRGNKLEVSKKLTIGRQTIYNYLQMAGLPKNYGKPSWVLAQRMAGE